MKPRTDIININKIKRPVIAYYECGTVRIYHPYRFNYDSIDKYGSKAVTNCSVYSLGLLSAKQEIFKDDLVAWQYI